jgi:hypothetical protein
MFRRSRFFPKSCFRSTTARIGTDMQPKLCRCTPVESVASRFGKLCGKTFAVSTRCLGEGGMGE